MMEDNSAVFSDGQSWNGTKPECLANSIFLGYIYLFIKFVLFSVPPITPVLELDGVEAFEPLASVGQQLKLVCKAQGGNPFPALAFMLNGERAEADNKEMLEYGGYNAVHTFTAEDHHANMEMDVLYTCGIKSSNSQF